jgi:hypothetical protein
MQLIETKTLGAAAASIEFTSIPQTFTDLLLLASGRTNFTGGPDEQMLFSFNASTSDFSSRVLFGNGSTATSSTVARFAGHFNSNTTTANSFSNFSVYLPNYSGATNKSYSGDSVYETNATEAFQVITAGLWSNTAAITSITLTGNASGSILAGSTVSLYGITKGTDGIVTTS